LFTPQILVFSRSLRNRSLRPCIQAQPRKIISSPTWSGIESETVSYNAGYTNVHEMIPWRTLTGRQQFYMDHPWMRAFGEGFSSYRPPVDLKTLHAKIGQLALENDFLSGALGKAGLLSAKK